MENRGKPLVIGSEAPVAMLVLMDDQRVGRIIRALRRRLGWRQSDLAARADCSQATISATERGHLPAVTILRRILAALDASLVIDVRWRAGALDRLLDEAHAALGAAVAQILADTGWEVRIEVTYSEFGERGSIDILAFMPSLGILLVIEIKTDLAAAEALFRKVDEKVRLAPDIARKRFGWDVQQVGWLLVMPESSTLRRRVERHAALFQRAFPASGSAIRAWLRRPTGSLAGLWFLSSSRHSSVKRSRGGPTRIRRPKRPSGSTGDVA